MIRSSSLSFCPSVVHAHASDNGIWGFPRFCTCRWSSDPVLEISPGNLDHVPHAHCICMQRVRWLLEDFHHFSREGGPRILRPTLALSTVRVLVRVFGALCTGTRPRGSCPQGHGSHKSFAIVQWSRQTHHCSSTRQNHHHHHQAQTGLCCSSVR